jgi:hypothetical protein
MAVAVESRLLPAGEQEKAGRDILSTCVVAVMTTSATLSCAMNGQGNDYRVAVMMQHHDCSHGAIKAMCNHLFGVSFPPPAAAAPRTVTPRRMMFLYGLVSD